MFAHCAVTAMWLYEDFWLPRNEWCDCSGDMLGLGALGLPSVFARLGWLPASVLLAVCAIGSLYSGRLFAIMAQQVCMARPLIPYLQSYDVDLLITLTEHRDSALRCIA